MAKSLIMVKDLENQRNSNNIGVGQKSDQTRSDKNLVAKGRDQKNKALIPNETNKVRSHKNYPKYLEYSNQIHMDKYICNKNE